MSFLLKALQPRFVNPSAIKNSDTDTSAVMDPKHYYNEFLDLFSPPFFSVPYSTTG